MADRGDTHYFTSTLNKWFLFSSFVLLVATVWMMVDDWNSPWKQYQREFRRVETAKTEANLKALESDAKIHATEAELKAAVEKAQQGLDAHKDKLEAANAKLFRVKSELYVKEQAAKVAKAEFDWQRYLVEEHRTATGKPLAEQDKLDQVQDKANATGLAKEQSELAMKAAQKEVDQITADVTAAEKSLAAGTRDLERLRKRLDTLDPSDKTVQVANVIRDAPGLDFVGPSLKVQKAVLDNLTFELNFTKSKRVDMCMTCHVTSDHEGYTDASDVEPLRTHPRLDLFLTAKSPHPIKDVGCTICHRGAGEALDFVRADHRPSSAKQDEAWKEKYDWHKQHHWDYPMLTDGFVEASCVQCHKTSMELIADEAPKVTEGYRLFEQYACYSCHKVDWFPTSRKPGPTLKNIQAKLKPEFVASWITKPKAFRPTTWMPQIFHLENFPENEPVVKSNYGAGPEIMGQQWNDTAVGAVVAFLFDRAPKKDLAPVPVKGDAVRGREVFRVSGCLGCHNVAPFEGTEAKTNDVAFEKHGTNEHGPNLRGVATKLNPEWLFWWIKEPAKYWPDTRMPNLRLADQEAADVAAYILEDPDGTFHDVPKSWEQKPSPVDGKALAEQARWFFSKLGRGEIQRRLEGQNPEFPWNDPDKLKVAVGEQFVLQQGCYSCHEIGGMEDMMPIGTELSNWGSKTIDKLDFGFAYQPPGSDRTEVGGHPVLDHEYREGWLGRKMHAPRSFDLQKVKNPKERLRMPYFAFTESQVDALSTFVVGLVDDEVQRAKMVPSSQKIAMDSGLRAIRQKNCMACHVIEPGTVTYKDEHGDERTLQGELMACENDKLPPPMQSKPVLDAYLAQYAKDNDEEVKEIGVRLLAVVPEVGVPGDIVFVPRKDLVDVRPAKGGNFVRTVTDYYFHGAPTFDAQAEKPEDAVVSVTADPERELKVQDVDLKFRAYASEQYDKVRWTFAPPVLLNEGGKLQREWFYAFLNDPMPLREQVRVRMPSFHFYEGEAGAIADYFALRSKDTWASRYARTMRLVLGMELKDKHKDDKLRAWPEVLAFKQTLNSLSIDEVAKGASLEPRTVRGIESGVRSDIDAGFDKLKAWGDKQGFRMQSSVNPAYERVSRRSPTYLADRQKMLAAAQGIVPGAAAQENAPENGAALKGGKSSPLQLGHAIVTKGVNCFQCHFHEGQPPDQKDSPISWGPDLGRVHERLREGWTEDFLWNPGLTYPGTSMPGNFLGDPPQYQDVYPKSSNAEQVQAVLDWLFNLDRTAPNAQ